MDRRHFIKNTGLGLGSAYLFSLFPSCAVEDEIHSLAFHNLVKGLLKDWVDGMLKVQIVKPDDLSAHGALACPGCNKIHGRCMDALYPFLYMADVTGEEKYKNAAISVFNWAENNVSQPNGAWSVMPNPKSWKGISVFGAIALAEALHYHGHILDEATRSKWTKRLKRVSEYIYTNFDLTFTNINYGATAIYGLWICGKVLHDKKYMDRSKELAAGIKPFFTSPNTLLWGEGKPSDKLSAKGLPAIDLGYNVEESLNSLVMYAVHEKDEELIQLLSKSLKGHMQFMLPDGAWDNSWGTRMFKWSYWGSRTTDGCQPAFAFMANQNPQFGTVAVKSTELLKSCTAKGLLHGGPHYVKHGVQPCVHHTFAHAKPLATLLNSWSRLPEINKNTALPRVKADGVKYFEELDTYLLARGNWRGTVSAYDAIYYKGMLRQATGGALSVLYHLKAGLIFAASMPIYQIGEKNNQQANPGEDFALTPRVETFVNEQWYTNLFDREAQLSCSDHDGVIQSVAQAILRNEENEEPKNTAAAFQITYQCEKGKMVISAESGDVIQSQTSLVLPIISASGEKVTQAAEDEILVQKEGGMVRIKANVPMLIKKTAHGRVFNMVPGAEAIPILAHFTEKEGQKISCTIEVM